jgi:hypothetical protein
MNPAYREEDQHMAEELKPVVVAPPPYASPNPDTMSGRLVPVEESPQAADLSEDYGAAVTDRVNVVDTDAFESTMTPEDGLQEVARQKSAATESDKPREEWSKADWQEKARSLGLAVGGSKADLQERVEAYEGEAEADKELNASDWIDEIEDAESADDLAAIRERYGAAEADYSTVDSAFEKKQAEFDGNDDEA